MKQRDKKTGVIRGYLGMIGILMIYLAPLLLLIGGCMLIDHILYGDASCTFKNCVDVKEVR